ncbi:hypothetical protein TraAM80_03291 [Trypanosoma rangeli]|uniref:Uncharacterized protein n=1 Tax=Trypanosoma rangeli TaxID=5698 RepID=A0A3R7KQC1_TRYRA|nr:uncharacterized protein TraAM80_03291 [Trypanosoma rangeli]RNF07547.1 hypothetical protein TraAM80_03291 [Trypanosoma rangeli]|eukprot:RNF07547.1 hypothetical protein TraAM80_03291 [Trypanosoma rangeli]
MNAGLEVKTEQGESEGVAGTATASTALEPLPLSSALLRDVEQLLSAARAITPFLTETTEQLQPMRAALTTVMGNLRICRHCIRRKNAPSIVPRLLIAGPAQTGKSAIVDFVLQHLMQTTLDTGAATTISREASTVVLKDEECNMSLDSMRKRSHSLLVRPHSSTVGNHNMDPKCNYGASHAKAGGMLCRKPSGVNGVEECDETEGILCSSESVTSVVNIVGRGNRLGSTHNLDYGLQQDATDSSSLNDRARRRHSHGDEGRRSIPLLKFVEISPLPDVYLPHSMTSDVASICIDTTPSSCVVVVSGGLETTIVDRMRSSQSGVIRNWLRGGQKETHRPNDGVHALPSHSGACGGQRTATASEGVEQAAVYIEPCSLCRAPSWLLLETAGNIVRSEGDGVPFVQLPDSLCAEAIFFTLPCEVVGTYRMATVMNKLFDPFVVPTEDDACDGTIGGERVLILAEQQQQQQCRRPRNKANCVHDEDDREALCQLISDMAFYILTFSDAIIARSEGVLTTDKQLANRPPPMAGSLPELIVLFQNEMRRIFGVHVNSWQVVPFSGPMSRVTSAAIRAIYEKRFTGVESLGADETLPSDSSAFSQLLPVDSTVSFPAPPVAGKTELNLQLAIAEYCDVVYGERFKQRQHRFSPDQLEELVWQHALSDMWQLSGARQLLHTVKCFEWNSLHHIVSHIAFSLVIFSRQLQSLLPKVQECLWMQKKHLQNELKRRKRENFMANMALRRLKEMHIPGQMIQGVLYMIEEHFEEVVIRFWWTLLTLLDEENVRFGVYRRGGAKMLSDSCRHPLLTPSDLSVAARKRLCKLYRRFLEVHMTQGYETQMSHLQSIIEEACRQTSNPTLCGGQRELSDAEAVHGLSPRTASVLPPDLVHLVEDARHHIPFVAKNARGLKRTMQKELSLLVARLNTEVINYFMAELANAMHGFDKLCEMQLEVSKETMLQLVTAVNPRQTFDAIELKLLRSLLSKIQRFTLLELRPDQELEAFVTGLRSALCQDQVKMYVKLLNGGWNGQCTDCAANTLAYLAKSEECDTQRQQQPPDRVMLRNSSFFHQLRGYRDIAWAPMEMTELTLPSPNRVRKSTRVGLKHHSSMDDAAGTTVANPLVEACTVPLREPPNEDDKVPLHVCNDVVASTSNPIWFFLVVWQEVFSVMTFRPWMLLHNVRYATLLNKITLIFLKGQGRLEAMVKEESDKAEAKLRSLSQEKTRLREELPSLLQHLSTTAEGVAHEMKSFNAETFRSLSM